MVMRSRRNLSNIQNMQGGRNSIQNSKGVPCVPMVNIQFRNEQGTSKSNENPKPMQSIELLMQKKSSNQRYDDNIKSRDKGRFCRGRVLQSCSLQKQSEPKQYPAAERKFKFVQKVTTPFWEEGNNAKSNEKSDQEAIKNDSTKGKVMQTPDCRDKSKAPEHRCKNKFNERLRSGFWRRQSDPFPEEFFECRESWRHFRIGKSWSRYFGNQIRLENLARNLCDLSSLLKAR